MARRTRSRPQLGALASEEVVSKKGAAKRPVGKKEVVKDLKPKTGKVVKGGRRAYEYDHHYGGS
jgi:hypothetical protein